MKKYFLSLLVLSAFSEQVAADPVRGLFATLRCGAQGIYENHTYTNPAGKDGKENKLNLSATYGFGFGLLNQAVSTKAVVGGEIFLGASTSSQKYVLRATNGPAEGNVSLKNPLKFGLAGILGTMLTPKLMVYAKAGFGWSLFRMNYSNLNNGETPNFRNYRKYLKGPVGGAGANYLIGDKFMVGGEYTYFRPGEVTPRKLNVPENGVARQYKFAPTAHQVTLGFGILF